MNWKNWLTVAALLITPTSIETFAQVPRVQPSTTRILQNRDILRMVRSGMQSHLIIATIMTSSCNFDIFPPVLDDLRRRGVPENVLHFMSVVPNGRPHLPEPGPEPGQPTAVSLIRTVKIPRGTVVLVETLYPISSADFKLNNSVAFSVVRPVFVDGVLLIPRGTTARAKIVKVKKAKSWGRGGALTFEMEHIVAIDGTRIPVQLTAAAEGNNKSGVVAVGAAATSALIFPYTAPAAIVWGFRKGDDAIVRGSKVFGAVIESETEVSGLIPDKDKIIYHYAEALKAKESSTTTQTAFPRLTIRN
jgi:hypothetical protein